MSAREELIEIVTRDAQSSGGDRTWAEDLVDSLLHEAAEKIRNSPGWCQGEWMDSRDREHAAKLIDPYKE